RLLTVNDRFRCHVLCSLLALDDRQHLVLTQNQVLDVVDLDFGAGVLADEDAVALLDVEGKLLAFLVALALADADVPRLRRLLLRAGRDDDAALLRLAGLETLDQDPIVKWPNLHETSSCESWIAFFKCASGFGPLRRKRILALLSIEC